MAVFVKWDINWICWSCRLYIRRRLEIPKLMRHCDIVGETWLTKPNQQIHGNPIVKNIFIVFVFWKLKTTKTDWAGSIVQLIFFSENSKSAQKGMKHKHKPYPLRSQLFWWNMNFPAPHIINMHKYYLRYLKVKAETLNTCTSTSWTKKKLRCVISLKSLACISVSWDIQSQISS